uniref:Uncharacterized protein n=1 Tax=Cacopsylla melanoneura TaxID=428564 RepID=A0A8D8WRN8_9HEMI
MTKEANKFTTRITRHNKGNKADIIFETLTLKEIDVEFDKLVTKHQNESIFALYQRTKQIYNTIELELNKKINKFEEEARSMQLKIFSDKKRIKELVEENEYQINSYEEEEVKTKQELKGLKEIIKNKENDLNERKIKIEQLSRQ